MKPAFPGSANTGCPLPLFLRSPLADVLGEALRQWAIPRVKKEIDLARKRALGAYFALRVVYLGAELPPEFRDHGTDDLLDVGECLRRNVQWNAQVLHHAFPLCR